MSRAMRLRAVARHAGQRGAALALAALALAALAPAAARADATAPAADAPAPRPLRAVGSDLLSPLMERWARALEARTPGLRVTVSRPGSTAGPPALADGEAELAPMSREMTPEESAEVTARLGHPPFALKVALGAILVVVGEDNPLTALTVPQLDAIYSSTRRCGAPEAIERWSALGVARAADDDAIVPCGRDERAGAREFFRRHALCGGDFAADVRDQPGAASVRTAVAEGYCGIGYGSAPEGHPGVRFVPIARDAASAPVTPSEETVAARTYPLSRDLYVVVDRAPGGALAPDVAAFLSFALSAEGQAMAREAGLLPLPEAERAAEAAKLR